MTEFEAGSFKDPDGRVFAHGGRVFRAMSPGGFARIQTLIGDGRLDVLVRSALVLPSWLVSSEQAGLQPEIHGGAVVEHPVIRVLNYPYEWSFDMMRDAALLTLELLRHCLDLGLILKDATPYNVMFVDGRMTFIDVLSIDFYADGQPWHGYTQFCREFLFPLMLSSYKRIEFQLWMRAYFSGIGANDVSRFFSLFDWVRPGVARHALLHGFLDRSFAGEGFEISEELAHVHISKRRIRRQIDKLYNLIRSMKYQPAGDRWVAYTTEGPYTDEDARQKQRFVESALREVIDVKQVIDIGCNVGAYALSVARTVDRVIAMDSDPPCVNALYREIRGAGIKNVVPMVGDLLNPSPALGWQLRERKSLLDRMRSDGFLALALVHHVCIDGNVPVESFVRALAETGRFGVVEWVDRRDAIAARMLRNRSGVFDNYTWEHFEAALRAHFEVRREITVGDTRRLCFVARRRDWAATLN